MKPIEEMTGLELREAVAVEIIGVHIRKQRGARSHLRDLVIPGGVDGIDFVQEEDEPELTVHTLIKGVPAYESSIEAAFQVVGTLSTKGYDTCLSNGNGPTFAWDCEMTPKGRDTSKPCVLGQANDPALAICRAALKAVRAK